MDKKRSLGVTVLGGVLIFIALAFGFHFVIMTMRRGFLYYPMKSIGSCLAISAAFVLGTGILSLRNWARIISLALAWIITLGSLGAIAVGLLSPYAWDSPAIIIALCAFLMPLIVVIPMIIFLQNPNVKGQFTDLP